jgi:hypothetical protein
MESHTRMRHAPATLLLAVLALSACRAVPVAQTGGEDGSGAPPLGQAPWLAPPSPGWALIVPEAANRTVLLFTPSLERDGDRSRALILINYASPLQRVGGRWVRSEIARVEADCAGSTYRLGERRLHGSHGGGGDALAVVPFDEAAPMREVQPGSIAEDVVAALCRQVQPGA